MKRITFSFVLSSLLATAAPLVAHADTAQVVIDASAPGEAVASVDVFYDQLSPYGMWVDDERMGRVFIPQEDTYVPYTNGHWEDTNLGFVWISDEPFAWATTHYGRWAYSQPYARWVWMPDTEWGPAWVDWRESGDDFGWAPMAPDVLISVGYETPVDYWHYCPAEHVLDVDVRREYVPRERVHEIHSRAKTIEYRANIGSRRVVTGPTVEKLRAHKVTVQPKKIDAKAAGRFSASEARQAETKARENRAKVDAENKKKIESHPKVKAVVEKTQTTTKTTTTEKRTTTTPPKPETKETRTNPTTNNAREEAQKREQAEKREEAQKREQTQQREREQNQRKEQQKRPEPQHTQPRAEPEKRPEPKAEKRPEPKAEPRAEQRPEPKAEPKRESREPQHAPVKDDKRRDDDKSHK